MFKTSLATEKAENTRQLIFQNALELFRERGFDDTTMQEIAARAGVAKGAAYYYFPGKEAIIQAYYESIQAEQGEFAGEAFAGAGSLKDPACCCDATRSLTLRRRTANYLASFFAIPRRTWSSALVP